MLWHCAMTLTVLVSLYRDFDRCRVDRLVDSQAGRCDNERPNRRQRRWWNLVVTHPLLPAPAGVHSDPIGADSISQTSSEILAGPLADREATEPACGPRVPAAVVAWHNHSLIVACMGSGPRDMDARPTPQLTMDQRPDIFRDRAGQPEPRNRQPPPDPPTKDRACGPTPRPRGSSIWLRYPAHQRRTRARSRLSPNSMAGPVAAGSTAVWQLDGSWNPIAAIKGCGLAAAPGAVTRPRPEPGVTAPKARRGARQPTISRGQVVDRWPPWRHRVDRGRRGNARGRGAHSRGARCRYFGSLDRTGH